MSYTDPNAPQQSSSSVQPVRPSFSKRTVLLAVLVVAALVVGSLLAYLVSIGVFAGRTELPSGGSLKVDVGSNVIAGTDAQEKPISVVYNPALYPELEAEMKEVSAGQLPSQLLAGKSGYLLVVESDASSAKFNESETVHDQVGVADDVLTRYQFRGEGYTGVSLRTADQVFAYRIGKQGTKLFISPYQNQTDLTAFIAAVSSYQE